MLFLKLLIEILNQIECIENYNLCDMYNIDSLNYKLIKVDNSN